MVLALRYNYIIYYNSMTIKFIVQFYTLSGLKREKKFKTFEDAKKHYDSYINNMGFWYNISMVKRTQ